jgi:hypothetical protein
MLIISILWFLRNRFRAYKFYLPKGKNTEGPFAIVKWPLSIFRVLRSIATQHITQTA